MPTAIFRRRLLSVTLLACLCVLVGCATVTSAPTNSHLSGDWRLDTAASDDVDAKIAAAVAKAQERLRKQRRNAGFSGPGSPGVAGDPGDGSGSTDSGGSGPDDNAPFYDSSGAMRLGPDFKGLRSKLLATINISKQLTLQVHGDQVEIRANDLPPRNYHVGEDFSRIDEYGTASISTRWQNDVFELRARYLGGGGGSRTERYATGTAGDQLTVTRLLEDNVLGKLQLHSVYRRAATP